MDNIYYMNYIGYILYELRWIYITWIIYYYGCIGNLITYSQHYRIT